MSLIETQKVLEIIREVASAYPEDVFPTDPAARLVRHVIGNIESRVICASVVDATPATSHQEQMRYNLRTLSVNGVFKISSDNKHVYDVARELGCVIRTRKLASGGWLVTKLSEVRIAKIGGCA